MLLVRKKDQDYKLCGAWNPEKETRTDLPKVSFVLWVKAQDNRHQSRHRVVKTLYFNRAIVCNWMEGHQ